MYEQSNRMTASWPMLHGFKLKRAINITKTLSRIIKHGIRVLFHIDSRTFRATIKRLVPTIIRPYLKRAENKIRHISDWTDRRRSTLVLQSILNEHAGCKGIVVLPPLIDWNWMKQRPHHLLVEFARAGYLVFFCSPRTRTDEFRGFQQVGDCLYLCSSVEILQCHLRRPIVLATYPGHLEEIQRFKDPRVIYDHLDDLRVHCDGNIINYIAIVQHKELLKTAEVVCATAERLFMRIRAIRPDAILCPNGVHYDDFALDAAPPVPDDLEAIVANGKPIVGYYGALAKWLDYDLVKAVAEHCPYYQFVLIGPDYDGSLNKQIVTGTKNLHWLGEKKYEELPAYVHYFDVATIPFVLNEITECTSPVKLFEYMAAGRPIVTTDLPECRKYRSVLLAQ